MCAYCTLRSLVRRWVTVDPQSHRIETIDVRRHVCACMRCEAAPSLFETVRSATWIGKPTCEHKRKRKRTEPMRLSAEVSLDFFSRLVPLITNVSPCTYCIASPPREFNYPRGDQGVRVLCAPREWAALWPLAPSGSRVVLSISEKTLARRGTTRRAFTFVSRAGPHPVQSESGLRAAAVSPWPPHAVAVRVLCRTAAHAIHARAAFFPRQKKKEAHDAHRHQSPGLGRTKSNGPEQIECPAFPHVKRPDGFANEKRVRTDPFAPSRPILAGWL